MSTKSRPKLVKSTFDGVTKRSSIASSGELRKITEGIDSEESNFVNVKLTDLHDMIHSEMTSTIAAFKHDMTSELTSIIAAFKHEIATRFDDLDTNY